MDFSQTQGQLGQEIDLFILFFKLLLELLHSLTTQMHSVLNANIIQRSVHVHNWWLLRKNTTKSSVLDFSIIPTAVLVLREPCLLIKSCRGPLADMRLGGAIVRWPESGVVMEKLWSHLSTGG